MFFDFKKWVKNIQTAGYNGARTVFTLHCPHNRPATHGTSKHCIAIAKVEETQTISPTLQRNTKVTPWGVTWFFPSVT